MKHYKKKTFLVVDAGEDEVIIFVVAFFCHYDHAEEIAFLQSTYGTLLTIYFSVKGGKVMLKEMIRKMVWYGVTGVTKVF